jgi:hypothetical protein
MMRTRMLMSRLDLTDAGFMRKDPAELGVDVIK